MEGYVEGGCLITLTRLNGIKPTVRYMLPMDKWYDVFDFERSYQECWTGNKSEAGRFSIERASAYVLSQKSYPDELNVVNMIIEEGK